MVRPSVLVTGGASGIGRACAAWFVRAGARVTVLDRDASRIAERDATEVEVVHADVTDAAAVRRAIAALPALDVLVTAAGVLPRIVPAPEELPEREWDRTLDVNLKGTFVCAAAAGARMAETGRGSIVTVASVAAFLAARTYAYTASKAAVVALTRSLAATWGPRGVRVNAVAPGFVATPALDRAMHYGVLDAVDLAAQTAIGRLVTADEVAEVVGFLASPAASGITGAIVPVDGGTLACAGFLGPRDASA